MNMFSIFILLLSFLSFANQVYALRQLIEQNGIISVPFDLVSLDRYMIVPIALGTPPQEMSLVVDIGSDRTWIYKDTFQKDKSTTFFEQDSLDIKTQSDFSYQGSWTEERITFGSDAINHFNILFVDLIEGNERFLGALSFGREYDSKKFSLVYRLSALNKIFSPIFTIQFDQSELRGNIIIGDIPTTIKNQESFIGSCDLVTIDSGIKWACELTHVFFGILPKHNKHVDTETNKTVYSISSKESVTSIHQPAIFETIYNRIYVPLSFISDLEKNYFINTSSNIHICKKKEIDHSITFTCNMEEKAYLTNIHFFFDNELDLFLTHIELFDCSDIECNFLVEYNPLFTNWTIGIPLLKKFSTIFDYNIHQLSFHGLGHIAVVEIENSDKESSATSTFFKLLLLMFAFFAVGIVTIVAYIYIARKKNNARMKIEDKIYENFP